MGNHQANLPTQPDSSDRLWWSHIIQIQHGIEGSSKNYWSRGVGCARLLPEDAKHRKVVSHFNIVRNQEFSLLLDINHVVFVLLYPITILPNKSLLSIISWRSSSIKLQNTYFLMQSWPAISSWRCESLEYEINRCTLRTTLNFAVCGRFPMR